jgi:hypothetical protein
VPLPTDLDFRLKVLANSWTILRSGLSMGGRARLKVLASENPRMLSIVCKIELESRGKK